MFRNIIGVAIVVTGAVIVVLATVRAYAGDQYCFDDAGLLIEIPYKQKLVLVPAHWKEEDIYRESHRAVAVAKVMVRVCDDGQLVISPGYCPQDEQPVAVEGVQCGEELVISPASCAP